MKRLVMWVLAAAAAGPACAQVGVSIGINEPGVYGRIDLGEAPPPVALVAPRPVYLVPARPGYAPPPPVYLYVPLAEQRDWRRYCRRYDACGRPVYFVRDEWVRERYVHEHPGWRDQRRPGPPPRFDGRGDGPRHEMRDDGPRRDGRDDDGPRRDGHDNGRRGPGGPGRD